MLAIPLPVSPRDPPQALSVMCPREQIRRYRRHINIFENYLGNMGGFEYEVEMRCIFWQQCELAATIVAVLHASISGIFDLAIIANFRDGDNHHRLGLIAQVSAQAKGCWQGCPRKCHAAEQNDFPSAR